MSAIILASAFDQSEPQISCAVPAGIACAGGSEAAIVFGPAISDAPALTDWKLAPRPRHLWIELLQVEHRGTPFGFDWRLRKVGPSQTWGCVITSDSDHALTVRLSQSPCEEVLSGRGSVYLPAIPLAPAGTRGGLTVRDEMSFAMARFEWIWCGERDGTLAGDEFEGRGFQDGSSDACHE